jgi:cyclopropane fatty-acyl-phospholipid synthase-like methyltransferase
MTNDFWNSRFAELGYAYGTKPNTFLVSQKHYLMPGLKALAVGDGEGRNGVWLAQQGLDVLSVDGSEVGLSKAQELAKSRGVSIRTELADLTKWKWPEHEFDVVAAIFIHFPPEHRALMHEKMLRALKPGGVLIMEAFTPEQLEYKTGGPPVREMLYTEEMMRDEFSKGEILLLQQMLTDLHEGPYHLGTASVVRLVVKRKPLP